MVYKLYNVRRHTQLSHARGRRVKVRLDPANSLGVGVDLSGETRGRFDVSAQSMTIETFSAERPY